MDADSAQGLSLCIVLRLAYNAGTTPSRMLMVDWAVMHTSRHIDSRMADRKGSRNAGTSSAHVVLLEAEMAVVTVAEKLVTLRQRK